MFTNQLDEKYYHEIYADYKYINTHLPYNIPCDLHSDSYGCGWDYGGICGGGYGCGYGWLNGDGCSLLNAGGLSVSYGYL